MLFIPSGVSQYRYFFNTVGVTFPLVALTRIQSGSPWLGPLRVLMVMASIIVGWAVASIRPSRASFKLVAVCHALAP